MALTLKEQIIKKFVDLIIIDNPEAINTHTKLQIIIANPKELLELLKFLKMTPAFHCQQLIDLCAIDHLHYGQTEWDTENANRIGFSRAVDVRNYAKPASGSQITQTRFAVVYNLLSLTNNFRISVKCFLPDQALHIPSVTQIWPVANWYEREAFDLFGINFIDHPNLTKLLTDEGLLGHPLRKDFPLSGNTEVRFDGQQQKIVYEPVNVDPHLAVPKVIRHKISMDNLDK